MDDSTCSIFRRAAYDASSRTGASAYSRFMKACGHIGWCRRRSSSFPTGPSGSPSERWLRFSWNRPQRAGAAPMTIARSGADGLHTEQLRWRRRGHPAEDYLIRARVPAGTPRTGIAVDILVEDTSQREARVARAGIGGLQMVVAARSTDIAWGALPCATAVVGCRAATQSCSPRCESRPGAAVPDPVRGAVVDVPIGSEPAWCVCDVDDGRICPATAKDVSPVLDVILPLATTAAATVRAEPDQPEVAAGSISPRKCSRRCEGERQSPPSRGNFRRRRRIATRRWSRTRNCW